MKDKRKTERKKEGKGGGGLEEVRFGPE